MSSLPLQSAVEDVVAEFAEDAVAENAVAEVADSEVAEEDAVAEDGENAVAENTVAEVAVALEVAEVADGDAVAEEDAVAETAVAEVTVAEVAVATEVASRFRACQPLQSLPMQSTLQLAKSAVQCEPSRRLRRRQSMMASRVVIESSKTGRVSSLSVTFIR
jgi:hypothetical protein